MRTKLAIILFLLCGVGLSGCKKDDQVKGVLKDLDSFTTELVKKVEASPDPSIGVDEAQKFMDAKKSDLQTKLQTLQGVRGFQVSDDTKKTMTESITKNVSSVAALQIKYVTRSVKDSAFKSKLEKFVKEYTNLIKLS